MCKSCKNALLNYVSAGHGIGLKVVTLISLLISLAFSICTPLVIIPVAEEVGLNEAINELPVVTIENGKIVDPVFNNESFALPIAQEDDMNSQFTNQANRIVLNTVVDSITEIPSDVMMYITARNIYINDGKKQTIYTIPENTNTVLTHEVIKSLFHKLIWVVSLITALIFFVMSIVLFLLLYIPVIILGLIFNKDLTVDAWGRALSWPWIIMWGLVILNATIGGIHIPFYVVCVVPALIALILGASLKCTNKNNTDEEVSAIAPQMIESETTETISATAPIEEVQVVEKKSQPVVRKGKTSSQATKKATVKPKNVPVQRKKKK